MIGNLLGMYGADSGAEWFTGTDYTNAEQKQRMLASVRKMVEEYKMNLMCFFGYWAMRIIMVL